MITLDQLVEGKRGVLLDMDGLLVDTDVPSAEVKQRLLQERHGITLDAKSILQYCGMPDIKFYEWAVQEYHLAGDPDEMIEAHNREYDAQIARIREPLPGVQQFLEAMHDRNMQMAICSGSYRHQTALIRKNLG